MAFKGKREMPFNINARSILSAIINQLLTLYSSKHDEDKKKLQNQLLETKKQLKEMKRQNDKFTHKAKKVCGLAHLFQLSLLDSESGGPM